jgi:hypothetical protein
MSRPSGYHSRLVFGTSLFIFRFWNWLFRLSFSCFLLFSDKFQKSTLNEESGLRQNLFSLKILELESTTFYGQLVPSLHMLSGMWSYVLFVLEYCAEDGVSPCHCCVEWRLGIELK